MSLNITDQLCDELKQIIERIVALTNDYKYLQAKGLYHTLLRKLNWKSQNEEELEAGGANTRSQVHAHALSTSVLALLEEHKSTFELLLVRADEVEHAMDNLSLDANSAGDLKWIYGSSYLGVTTHYVVSTASPPQLSLPLPLPLSLSLSLQLIPSVNNRPSLPLSLSPPYFSL